MSSIFDLFKQIEKKSEAVGPITHLVVGLGNPGREYERTRHNAGFLAIDFIAERRSARIVDSRFKGLCGECVISGKRALLLKPHTFMNLSGESVRAAADFYKIPPENIIIIYDDTNFEPGHMRIRASGSSGGQKGMKNIIEQLSTEQFPRIRIGIGAKPSPDYDIKDWVLGKIPDSDLKAMQSIFPNADAALDDIVNGKIDIAMGKYNK